MTDTSEAQDQEQNEAQEQAQETQQAEISPEVSAEAERLGWRPVEEWDGDTDNWLPKDKYVERQERLRKRADRTLQTQNDKLGREIASLKTTIEDLGKHLTKADQRAYVKAARDLETTADRAAEDGDMDAYRKAKTEMKDLVQEVKTEEPNTRVPSPDNDVDFQSWLPDNAWYDPKDDDFDVELAGYADFIASQVGKKGLSGNPFYEAITKEVKKKFPDRFGNSRRRQAPAVEGGNNRGAGGKTLWDQVSNEDRKVFKSFVKQGLYKDDKEGREAYADIYVNG